MKPSQIMALIGGVIGGVAFFLPWISLGFFSFSLYDGVRLGSASTASDITNQVALLLIEPAAAGVLILFSLLAGSMGKGAHTLNLLGALAGLGFVVYLYVRIQGALTDFEASAFSVLGIGFWIAGVGFLLGAIGAIMGLSAQSARPVLLVPPGYQGFASPQIISPNPGAQFPQAPLPGQGSGPPQQFYPGQGSGPYQPTIPGQYPPTQ